MAQNFNVKITMSDQRLAALMVGYSAVRDIDVVQTTAQEAVTKLADGGLLLPGPVVKRIEKVLDKIEDPVEVAEAVEDGAGFEGDNVKVSMVMDPVWLGELQEKATVAGMSLNALASELQSQILSQGLLYDMATETLPIYLTPEQHGFLRKKLELRDDQPLFGETIVKHLGGKPVEEEVDLFAAKV